MMRYLTNYPSIDKITLLHLIRTVIIEILGKLPIESLKYLIIAVVKYTIEVLSIYQLIDKWMIMIFL